MSRCLLIRALLLISLTSVPCLGYFNCDDGPGSEEPCILQFDSDYFRCEDGTCVCRAAKCDGNNDCSDGSDEADPECDTIIAAVIGGVAGSALLCCLIPCLCTCCYCICKHSCCKKKTKTLADDSHTMSAMNHPSLSVQPSSDIREAMNRQSDIDNKNTEV